MNFVSLFLFFVILNLNLFQVSGYEAQLKVKVSLDFVSWVESKLPSAVLNAFSTATYHWKYYIDFDDYFMKYTYNGRCYIGSYRYVCLIIP